MKPADPVRLMIDTDQDFIASKRFDYSLKKLLERYPDGCPDRISASVLMITEEQLEAEYVVIVERLRHQMKLVSL